MNRFDGCFAARITIAAVVCLFAAARAFAQTPPDPQPPAEAAADPQQPIRVSPSLAQVFKDTVSDFRKLGSANSVVWLAIGGAAALGTHPGDEASVAALSGSPRLDAAFEAGDPLGGTTMQLGGAVAAYTIGRLTSHPQLAIVGADLLQAQLVERAVTGVIKVSARRTRPDGTSQSFPSGHASATFATATVLEREFGWKVGVPAFAVASYVAVARVETKAHFPSDVVFGAAIGIVAGRTVTIGRGRGQFGFSPTVVPGGGGAFFTWIGSRP